MAKKRFYDQSMDKANGAMIGSSGGMANMPQNVVMKHYPKDGPYFSSDLDDSMKEIAKTRSADVNKAKSQFNDSKF